MLAHGKIAITGAEREDMLALAGRMKLQGGLVPALCSPARGQARITARAAGRPGRNAC